MENKNNLAVILLTLIIGLLIGYYFGSNRMGNMWGRESVEINDMHHTMNGMMSGLNGKAGDELDRAFIDEMIVHHQGAIDMAKILLSGTKRPELIKLGNEIISAQSGEIEMMKGWRSSWFGY